MRLPLPRPPTVAAVTGGTDRYRTARGEVAIQAESDEILMKLAR